MSTLSAHVASLCVATLQATKQEPSPMGKDVHVTAQVHLFTQCIR